VLLLNPMDSVWALTPPRVFDPATSGDLWGLDTSFGERIGHINRMYSDAIEALTRERIEFVVADRHYLRQMETRAGKLVRGPLSFGAVILPPMDVLPLDAARKLLAFARSGGHVYALGDLPAGSPDNGMRDPEMIACMTDLAAQPTFSRREGAQGLVAAVESGAPGLGRHVRLATGGFDMLQRHTVIDGRDAFWLANNSPRLQRAQAVFANCRGFPVKWDCETGSRCRLPSSAQDDGALVSLTFSPYEGFWLVFEDAPGNETANAADEAPTLLATVDGPWTVRFPPEAQPPVQFPAEVPAELAAGTTRGLEPWSARGLDRFSGVCDYACEVSVPEGIDGPCYLDLGTVLYSAQVWLNGEDLGARLWPPHVFIATGRLKQGANELRIRVANLINNSYGDPRPSGLLGPIRLMRGRPDLPPVGGGTSPQGERVVLQSATADHSQPGFSVQGALDDAPAGWGAYDPRVGEPIAQTAVFETARNLGEDGRETELTFALRHAWPNPEGLCLGRFRISATTDDRATFADGLDSAGDIEADWSVLTPIATTSELGTPLVALPDGSVLAAVGALTQDTYFVTCRTALHGITGFRLEALEDPALPRKAGATTEGGPGLSPGEGNFVLSNISVFQSRPAP